MLTVEVFGRAIDIVMEKRLKGYPRDTTVAIEHLQELDNVRSSKQRIPMFIAPAISKSSRSLLQERGIGYWDSGGSLHLPICPSQVRTS